MRKNNLFKKIMSLLICLAMIMSYLPAATLSPVAASGQILNIVPGSKKSDPSTIDWEKYFGPDKLDTEFAGGVWTDKSVFSEATSELPGVTLTDNNNFLVALSAIASDLAITGHTSAPTDTMLVLDMSGSMVDDTYEVGTIRRNNRYVTVEGIDMSLINAMVEATNATIDKLMKQNTNNRVGVVLYSGNASSDEAATPSTAIVVLPLGRYNGVNGEYLSVDTTWRTDALYRYNWGGWQATGESATYVAEDTAVNVSVKDNLRTEAGASVTDNSKRANGGTYIQNGLYKAMGQFLSVTDTIVPEGRPQAGAERVPVLVLMTDGAPTIATTSYTNIGNSNTGDGTATNDRITFLTQLTAAYVRGRVAAHYQENANDKKDIMFLTLGLGTENSSAATNTLYPAGSNDNLVGYWDKYLAATAGNNVTAISGNNPLTVRREADVEAMNYVDTYYYANSAQELIDSFIKIVNEIELKSESYATLVEGDNADFSGYVTFEDELGEMMQVADMKGVLMSDGKGGVVLYTGKGIAESMSTGNLGSVDNPTERGDELVRTVRERIPGTTTTQAQQLIANAYNDRQLYYTNDENWSNYIGWYADADGNYVGFWDKESGYDSAPANAVYANRSYGYLGVNGDSDMMHVVVMVRTELKTLHQTVNFRIPASLLPTVQYKVTIDENDPTLVEKFEREDAIPMQLVFEVGLRSDINSVNLEQKIAEHIAKGGHVHRNNDGSVSFYTNEWAIGNDKNQNGIPDPEEVESALVAESHFHPAMDNSRYYYTEDTLILDKNGNPVTDPARPVGNYYHHRYIYNESKRITITMPISKENLANKAQYNQTTGQWYIPAGAMFSEVSRFKLDKTQNTTGTLPYSNFPAVFENAQKQDVYAFLGNNGTFTVAPATGITLRKQLQETIAGVNDYTFNITLSNIPSGKTATPVLTDINGEALAGVTMSALTNNQFTVTMPADVTAYISGIPVGTTVQISEQINGDYKIVDVEVSGQKQSVDAPATTTIPAYSENGTQMVPVVFTNAPNGYGDLVISKDVHHELESDPEALASKVFTFRVELSGNKINIGDTFETSIGSEVVVAADGTLKFLDGTAITLHNEESITIYRLPEGTAYTVEESDIPDGFELSSVNGTAATDANGIIEADTTDMAAFINRYPDNYDSVELDLNLTIKKILNGNPPDVENFEFALQQLLSDNTYPDIKLFTISSDDSSKIVTDTLKLKFDELGTYYYRILERAPQNPTPGMSYSTVNALFAVIVTDDDMDGRLEITVREEANIDASVTYGDAQNHETATDISVEAEFTNSYEVYSTNVAVDVNKVLVNNTGVDIPLTSFRFGLYKTDAQGNATGSPVYTATANALGHAVFNMIINENKDVTYIIKEIIPDIARVGMTYDASEYVLSIDVEADAKGQLSATTSIVLKGRESEGEKSAVFTNKYELTPASASFNFSKTLVGRALQANEEFQFLLVRTDDTYKPLAGKDAYSATYYLGSGTETISLNYDQSADKYLLDKAGTYHYILKEIAGSAPGVTYDSAEYHIAITVTDNGNGALVAAAPVIHKIGQANPVSTAAFVNTYTVTGSDEVIIGGEKILNGRAIVAGEFTIGLYSDAQCQNLIETTTNKANGSFEFSAITFTAADLGENNAKKTYTYYVKEVAGSKGGVTYDSNVYTVTATVDHKDGLLVVTPSDNAVDLKITNKYEAKPVEVVLNGSKVLSGDWSKVANKDFTFNLFEADAGFVITNHTPVKSASVNGNASFSITLDYEDGQEGMYYFVLKEDLSVKKSGISYDAGEYHITVNISDPGDGQLVAQVNIYRPGSGNTSEAVFTNKYSVDPITVTLDGTKSYVNSITNSPMNMEEGMFSFQVLENYNQDNAKLVATGYNLTDGTIKFTPISYSKAGIYKYSVIELPGNDGGVTYDTETVFNVTVTVVDNGDGTLTANVDYNNTAVEFENTYTHESAQVTFEGIKEFIGNWNAVSAGGKIFNFELFETDSSFVIDDSAIDSTTNETNGSFTFGTITYTTEGTHYYVIKERKGDLNKGITYDDKEYHITVVVEDDGNGNLIPSVTAKESGVTVTVDSANARLVTVSNLKFANSYKAGSVEYVPKAQKLYEGDAMKAFDFVLTVDGADKQTKQNNSNGEVVFDALTFDNAGVYELKIREQENILWGLIRWDRNVYTITLYVEDNGEGKLFVNESKTVITSDKGRDDLIFRNAHHSVITNKDVFSVNEPTVSIDGKSVEKNDVLLYKITYKNYDSVPVDIVITDTIPQYTTYVTGSADNNGTLNGNELKWTINNVLPDAVVTVSFKVKVVETNVTIVNGATILEGTNTYITNEVTNPVKEDKVYKDVFLPVAPTVSIDGKAVEKNDVLLYKITYTNSDDFDADVTITDSIPQYTTYVENSADNGGTFASGVVTWNLHLSAGESKTVSFKVKVVDTKITVINEASALEGENTLKTNQVRNPVDEDIVIKDVFDANAPTVSIDGKAVEIGDVLLYKLTYTNFDGQDAEVTIADTIPQYTAYVENSADNNGVFANGELTWKFELSAGESKTVSFKVKVTGKDGEVIINQASGVEGENNIESNQITNIIKEDKIVKDVFDAKAPTVSIDGKQVEVNDILLYTITYTNSDDFDADVTITDTIPQYTTYVANSADNDGIFADGVLTWNLKLAAGESKTVSFKVKATTSAVIIKNQAYALEGENELSSNVVTNRTPAPDKSPVTGVGSNLWKWIALLFISGSSIFGIAVYECKKRVNKAD